MEELSIDYKRIKTTPKKIFGHAYVKRKGQEWTGIASRIKEQINIPT